MENILSVKNIIKTYQVKQSLFSKASVCKALNDISFDLPVAKTLAIIGESGCGKTTIAKLIMGIEASDQGQILFKNENISKFNTKRPVNLIKEIQIVFQNPYSSLNPRQTAFDIIAEPLLLHGKMNAKSRFNLVMEMFSKVGLNDNYAKRYPHMFSGGQRQRIAIARALILNPSLIVLDEPVSALDLSIQAQVLNLLQDLKAEFKLSYLFITHNISLIQHFADFVVVMYLGKVLEKGPAGQVLKNPMHPYTKALLSSTLMVNNRHNKEIESIIGELPSPFNPPSGCPFVTRCPIAIDQCHLAFPNQVINNEQIAHCIRIN